MKYLLLPLFLLLGLTLQAQEPIKVTPIAVPPYPTVFSDYLGRTGSPVLLLTNIDPVNDYAVMIGLKASGDNGLTVRSNPSKQPIEPIKIQPGETVMLTADEILDLYANFTPDDLTYEGIKAADIIQSQSIPEGTYTACVTAYDFNTGEPLSLPGCTPPINIRHLDPPIITAPQPDDVIEAGIPDVIRFAWTPVAGATVPIAYRFRLAQVPKGVNPYDAVADDDLLWFEDETLVPFLFYDPTFPPLEEDQTYALQIIAYDEDGAVIIRNDGRSDVVVFRYQLATLQAPAWVAPTDRFINTLEDGNVGFGWTRVDNGRVQVDYELFVYHIPENETLAGVLTDPDTYLVVNETSNGTGYLWQTGKLDDYVELGQYAARVKASSDEANVDNNGYSEWLYFEVIDDASTGNMSPLEVVQKNCGARFQVRGPQVRNPKNLAVGQRIRMHDLLLEVNSVVASGGGTYNGIATTLPTEQLPAIELQFNNLTVNKFGEVIAGQLEGSYRDGSTLPQAWRNARTPLTMDGLNRSFMREEPSIYAQGRPDNRLPLRLDNGLLLTALTISPQSSKAKVVHLDYFTQGTVGNADWLVYGVGNADFTNAGLVYRNGEGALPLIEEVAFQQGPAYRLRLYPGADGSQLYFDCAGVTGYQILGEAKSNSRNCLRTETGQPVYIGGFINDRVATPNDFVTRLTSRSPNGAPATFSTDAFVHISLPGHPLDPDSLILDHSMVANPVGLTLPEGSSPLYGGGDRWRGLAMPTLKMTLPPAIVDEESGERIVREIENFVIDSEGMSGATAQLVSTALLEPLVTSPDLDLGLNLNLNPTQDIVADLQPTGFLNGETNAPVPAEPELSGRTFQLGGWPTTLDSYYAKLVNDDLAGSHIIGRIMPDLLGATGLRFVGDFTASTSTVNITAELETKDRNFTMPLWKATGKLDELSELSIRLFNQGSRQSAEIDMRLNGTLKLAGDYGDVGTVSIPEIQFQDLVLNSQGRADGDDFSFGYLSITSEDNMVAGYAIQPGQLYVGHDHFSHSLSLDYDFELGGTDGGVAASTTLQLIGEGGHAIGFEYEGSELAEIQLPPGHAGGADVMAYDAGTVVWEDDGYGAFGFRGEFGGRMGLLGDGGFTVIAQFGRTNRGQNYWGMQVDVDLPAFATIPSGIPGFNIGGFGGGIYYNMMKSDLPPVYQGTVLPLQDYRYVPRTDGLSSFGLDINVLMHTVGSESLVNGRFGLGFDFLSGELTTVTLKGQAHFMEESTISPDHWARTGRASGAAGIAVFGEIVWDVDGGALYGNIGYDIGIGPGDLINGYHESALDFYFNSNGDWHFEVGSQRQPLQINFTPEITVFDETIPLGNYSMNAYFMTGNTYDDRGRWPVVRWGLGNEVTFGVEFGIPFTGGDKIRIGGKSYWWANGYLGYGNTNCGASDHFFTKVEAHFGAGLRFSWYDDCDKWELGTCNDWTSVGADFDLEARAYFYRPSGVGVRVDLPILDPFYLYLGDSCGF
ncbi:MAG: hypothetical protein AAF840_00690 [Bacteroidota bacterium]